MKKLNPFWMAALAFSACTMDETAQPSYGDFAADDPAQETQAAPSEQTASAEPQFLALAEPVKNAKDFTVYLFSSLDLKNVGFVVSKNSWIAGGKVKSAKESEARKLFTYRMTFRANLTDDSPVAFRGQAGNDIYVVNFVAKPTDKGMTLEKGEQFVVASAEYSKNGSALPDNVVPETFVSLGSQISGSDGLIADESGASQRALDCLHRAQRSMGGRVGGGGCNALTNDLNGGRMVGAMRSVQCLPGDVLRWGGGANLRLTSGGNVFTSSGHYAVVESDNGNTVTFLHQNNAGSGVQRATAYKTSYGGSVTVYRP